MAVADIKDLVPGATVYAGKGSAQRVYTVLAVPHRGVKDGIWIVSVADQNDVWNTLCLRDYGVTGIDYSDYTDEITRRLFTTKEEA